MKFPRYSRLRSLAMSATLVAVMASGAAFAKGESLKIAVVDLQEILTSTRVGKAAQAKFERVRKNKRRELEKIDKGLQAKEKDLVRARMEIEKEIAAAGGLDKIPDALKAKATAFQKSAQEFQQKVVDFQKTQRSMVEDLAKQEGDLLKPVEQSIRKHIDAVAKAQGYDLVLSRQVAIYATAAIDITGEVARRVNAD